jgi:hypothetical protein
VFLLSFLCIPTGKVKQKLFPPNHQAVRKFEHATLFLLGLGAMTPRRKHS